MFKSDIKLNISKDSIKVLEEFLKSQHFQKKDKNRLDSYSPYWIEHAYKMSFQIKNKEIKLEGESGFYIPQKKHIFKIIKLLLKPITLVKKLAHKIKTPKKLLSPRKAFDYIMQKPPLEKNLVNIKFDHYAQKIRHKKIIPSSKEIDLHFKKWNNFLVNDSLIFQYYYRNLLIPFIKRKGAFIEIGAGSGNLVNLLTYEYRPKNFVIVDLPESIINSFTFLNKVLPNNSFYLPHKISSIRDFNNIFQNTKMQSTNFIFMTPWQLKFIPNNLFDLSINVASFQEMRKSEISKYFKFIQNRSKKNGLFFCVNRLEKTPTSKLIKSKVESNRFHEYPWYKENKKLINEISELSKMTSFNHLGIRLERICK